VRELSLTVESGSFVSILGPSGCGKSTLLQVVAGLLRPSEGDVKLFGHAVDGPSTNIGMVFQQPTLLPWRTARDNILIPARARGLDMTKARKRADELIDLVRLTGFADRYPHELSGGMQQRVGIARALLHGPEVLLMDEPFAALDALTREKMSLDLLDFWSMTKRTVLFVTHSVQEATFLSDRVIVLSQRPAKIMVDMVIDLPRPRSLKTLASPEFASQSDTLRRALFKVAEEAE
jgi:NitT/TauT family transport system ATP-binding protein